MCLLSLHAGLCGQWAIENNTRCLRLCSQMQNAWQQLLHGTGATPRGAQGTPEDHRRSCISQDTPMLPAELYSHALTTSAPDHAEQLFHINDGRCINLL